MGRKLKHWGWGYQDEQLNVAAQREAATLLSAHLGFGSAEPEQPVALSQVSLPPPRLRAPDSLGSICRADPYERALHAHGSSYADVVRAFRGQFDAAPDVVAHPGDEDELVRVLDWALSAGAAVIPFGGGTSVVGGVQPRVDRERYSGVVTIDVKRLDRVLEVDPVSLAARVQAGATGPGLEAQLGEHGLTLRHFPQSFAFSTLGGWIATRAGGHFATLYTHIDDLVESVRALTPAGVWESRRLPGSGAGVSPDRLLIGSEGTLGVITEAWMRVRERPRHRTSVGVRFPDFLTGAGAVRAISQSGLHPSNCRLIDPAEAALTGAGDGSGLCSCSASSPPRCQSTGSWPRRWSCAVITAAAGTGPPRAGGAAPVRAGSQAAATRSEAGARRSCALPTCVTRSWRWACCRRRSRRRSPGTGSRRCTRA